MHLDYTKLIHLLFPPSPDEVQLAALPDATLLPLCRPIDQGSVTTLLPYRDPYVRAAIHLNKFHHHRHATHLLAECLATAIRTWPLETMIFVPVPLSSQRQRDRGYNQVTEILQAARRHEPRLTVSTRLLRRVRHTVPQTSLTRAERRRNLNQAFVLNSRIARRFTEKHMILVDDVLTTGATLQAAKRALTTGTFCSIQCIALAH